MEEPPPPPPPPSDLSDAVAPQPTAAESGEEKLQSVPQCKEVDGRQSTQSMGESATEEPDRLTEESAVPNPQCPQSDDGVERRSAADEEEGAESMSAVEEEEKPQVDGSDERVSSLREEKLVEEVEKASSLKEEEEKVLTSEPGAAVDEVMQENVEEKISDVAGSCPTEELDGERPQLAERNEKVYSLKEKEEEEEEDDDDEEEHAPHSEPAVDVIMPENLEEKPRQTEELNRERHQPAEGDGQGYSLQQAFLENEENSSSSEEGLDGEEEEKIPVSGGIMQESVEEKLPDFGGMQPAEQLDEKMPHSTEKDENLSSLQEEFVAGEEKVPLSQLSGSIADVDEIMHENVEGKLPEEQLNEDKPQSVRKGQKVAPSRRGLEEEDEKVSSLQEEYAEKDEKVSTVQEESDDKEEFDEKEEAEEMDMDEPPPAMAAGRRTGTKRKRGRPPVAQGRKARALPKPKEEEEELCFICFDGGDLVVCDHRGCPKVYHPSCVNRDEAYFKAKGQWSCGWHICSNCQKSARYMCYTCTYSLCKRCIKEAEFFCVRGNRGFCETCMKTVMQIEMNKHADETTDVVDFDDKASWMYLFKDYWIDLKAKLSLTIEELTGARNPLKETSATSNEEPLDKKKVTQWNKEPSENPGNASDDQGGCSSSFLRCYKERDSSRKKVKKRPRNMANKEHSVKGAGANRTSISEDVEWASEELLEFVAHMKDGDRSVQSQFDVQALLLEYIKQNNFRDPRRKSQVICDSRLRALFGKSCVGHLEMLKLLEPHFLIKEASPLAADDNQGGVVDPDPSQTEADGNNNASTKMNLDTRHKPRRRVEEKGLINLDDYAAIDVHNVSLMYLRRKLMEDFLDDIDMFNENVVGSFIRIRISGSASNKDMYRLVQVVGTSKAAERYNTGKKTTDTTLEVLNLNKREFLTIDLISNQEFTEEECKRLRQSVKCGFIDRLTAAEVQEKAKLLHTVKVNDWFESEKLRLGHLRDRASEKGRKKEHRECVEKLQLLSTLEERNRRLNEIPEIHVDPNMAPDYDSTEDEDDLNAKRQDNDKMPKSSLKDRDEFSARRGGSASRKNSDAVWNSNRSTSKPGVHDVVLPTVPADRTNGLSRNHENDGHQVTSPTTPKAKANATGVDTVVLKNAQPVVEHGQSSGVWPETAPQPANVMSSNTSVTEKMWHYQDPAGKIQGPFSMTQLRKWNASNFFPTNLRIWRTSEKQEDSILLTDALTGKFHRDLQQQEPQHSNSTHSTNVPAVVDSRVNRLADGMRGNNNQTTASFPATGNYNSAKCDRWTTQPSSLSPNNTGIVSPMDRRPTKSSTGWESSKDSNAWSGQSQVYNSPRPITPLSRNSSQQPSFQGRDGRGGNTGRWNGGRGHQNNWNSNKHRRFQTNGRGYERQHPYQSSSSQQFPGEQWKMQPANDSPNQLVSSSARGPKPSSIDWASLQGALNRILPSSSIQPMSSGPSTIPRGSEVQQFPYNLTSPLMNSVGGWTSNSLPNVNPAKTQETVGVMSNFQQQNKPSASPALLTSGNHAFCSGSNTAEFVDGSDWKQRLESDNSNTTPNSEQASSDVLNSGSIQPANSQLNEAGDRGIPSNKLDSNKKCPEVHDRSASENRKTSVGGTGPELGPASVAPNALGSSNIPDASVSVQRLEASSSKAQFEYQCWPPASSQQQAPNNSSVNPNPAQPLNMGWGMAPQHPNPGLETVQEIGNMVYPAIPGAANMGWGMMAHELMNMMWGTPANLNWVQPAQSPMNAHLGWAIPQQGNANVNLALGAQTQTNPNAGWVMPMQVNSAQNPGWVAPNVGNASPNSGCVAPTEGNANQNAAWGTLMLGTGQGNINNAANQNGGGGKTDSFGDGGSSHALPPAEQIGVCIFHENGRCKKGASCNYIHS